MPKDWRDLLAGLAALALGLAAFLLFVGWQTLVPSNIGWLNFADRGMHTLGWMFYRAAPWDLPPGISPRLGIELSSSIALVDGLPLFAIPFKLLSPWLPPVFQYWGYWLLLSFCLQSLLAYRIARELGATWLVAVVAAAFALITPAYLFRVPMHLALAGHWVVLAGLLLYVRRKPPALWMWPLLCGLTAAVHAYLLAMVLALWAAAWVERLWSRRIAGAAAFVEILLVATATGAVLWAVGFFVTPSIGSYGYGDYKLNLLWPLLTYQNWSQLFPDWPHTKYDYEGLSFLGIGILALLALALLTGAFTRLRAIVTRRWLPLTLVLLGLMVFAFSKDMSFGSTQLLKLDLPRWADDFGATFRSTGRFVWPLLYFITIGAVVLAAGRWRALIAVPLVLVAFGAQAWDSWPALTGFAKRQSAPSEIWSTPLTSPFWRRAAAAGYNRVRVIPVQDPGTDWRPLGYYAVTHGMDIDSAYLGRLDIRGLAHLRLREADVLRIGDFEPNTIYELDAISALKAAEHMGPDDLLATIDHRIILAKGGAYLVEGLGIEPHFGGIEPATGSGWARLP